IDEEQRRAGDVSEHRSRGGGVAQEIANAEGGQQTAKVVADNRRWTEADVWITPRTLAEDSHRAEQHRSASDRHEVDGPPTANGEERRANGRRNHRHDIDRKDYIVHLCASGVSDEEIAKDSNGGHSWPRGPRPLQRAKKQQLR